MVKKSLLLIYRATLLTLWLIIIVLTVSVLALRYVVLPQIDQHKDKIAQHISQTVGQKITIGNIKAGWNGLNPRLTLHDVDVYDKQSRSALSLDNIETSLSWFSIPLLEPRLSELTIYQPSLTVRREANGTVYVAGIEMGGGESNPAFANWLLRQSQVDVIDATILWQDDMRQAPPLTLNNLRLQLSSPPWGRLVGQHRFGLRATPSAGSSQPIDLRGNVYGHDVSQLDKWHGRVYGHMEGTDISAWRNWISYPFNLTEGFGAARFWLDFANGEIERVTSDVLLNNVKTRLSKSTVEAELESLSGRLKFTRHNDGQELLAEKIKIATADGLNMQNGKVNIRERLIAGKDVIEGQVELDEITLESANTFASYLPLPQQTLQQIADIEPVGKLEDLKLSWKGDSKLPDEYSISSVFSGLGMKAYKKIPGFSNLKGHIDADEATGTLILDSRNASLDFQPTLRWPILADKMSAQIKWRNTKDAVDVRVNNLAIESAHLSGTVNGSYLHQDNNDDAINLVARVSRADAKFAHFYYPTTLSPDTLSWLDTSIQAGQGKDASVVVRGKLAEFPWADSKKGLFQVKAKVTDGMLDYATGWPKIEGIALDLLFQGNRMELNADKGRLFGSQIIKAQAVIPVLDADHPVLEVNGEVDAPPAEAIKYINASPVLEAINGFTEGMQASGSGKLLLGLNIPLDAEGEGSKVKGSYTVKNGTLSGGDEFPALSAINGKLDFTETTVRAQKIAAQIYGGPAQFSLANGKDGQLRVVAQGRMTDQGIREATGSPLAEELQGATDWRAEINVRQRQTDLVVTSSLSGLASTLPPPFNKAAADALPLRVEKKMQGADGDMINLSVGDAVSAKLLRTAQNGVMRIERGEIALGGNAGLPEQPGLYLKGQMQHMDVDQWLALLDDGNASDGTTGSTSGNTEGKLNIKGANLQFGTLDVFGRRINDLKLQAKATSDGWDMNLLSREINGDASWAGGGNGKIVARLKSLITPSAAPAKISDAEIAAKKDFTYPALDIIAEEFETAQKKLGRLEVQASERNNNWHIQKLRISNPESVLTGEGDWLSWNRNPSTRLNINWKISDVGGTLDRFGYPNAVKGGEADFIGQLNWPGSPHQFDYPGLNGSFKIEARKGQILEIKPGVGRLFSVLSLQNLPRRLSFDFRDVFSSGFAFDKISANVKIDHGIMRSDDFILEGPTARVEMKGETDLKKETQHLFVKVTPYISDGLSLAALAGGPAVAAAAYLAQKLLKDPLNKLAVDRYEIVGTWDDPQEVKPEAKDKALTPSPLGNQ